MRPLNSFLAELGDGWLVTDIYEWTWFSTAAQTRDDLVQWLPSLDAFSCPQFRHYVAETGLDRWLFEPTRRSTRTSPPPLSRLSIDPRDWASRSSTPNWKQAKLRHIESLDPLLIASRCGYSYIKPVPWERKPDAGP